MTVSTTDLVSLLLAGISLVIAIVLFGWQIWLAVKLHDVATAAAKNAEISAKATEAEVKALLSEIRGKVDVIIEHSENQFQTMLDAYVRGPQRDEDVQAKSVSGDVALSDALARIERLEQTPAENPAPPVELDEIKQIIRGVQSDLAEIRRTSGGMFTVAPRHSDIAKRIMVSLARRPQSSTDLVASGLPRTVTVRALSELIMEGAVENIPGSDTYALTRRGKDILDDL